MSGEGQGCQLLPAQSPSHSSGERGQTLGRTSAPPPQEGSHVTWTQHPCPTASQAKRSPSSSQPPCPTGSPPQAGHAMHSHAAARVITELVLQQAQPVLHHFARWGRPIIKWPVLQKAAARQDPHLRGGVRAGTQASLPRGTLTSKEDVGSPPRVRVGAQAPESAPLQGSSPLSPPGSLPRTPCSFRGAAREPYSPSRQSTLQFRLTQPEPVWVRRPKGSGP